MENFDDTNILKSEEMLPKGLPFDVPEGYFLSLADIIETRIAINDYDSLGQANKLSSFDLQENYFENLPLHIENKIAQKEFEKSVEDSFFEDQKENILSSIKLNDKVKSGLPFEVPLNYFIDLTSSIESKIPFKEKQGRKQFIFYKWVYAAAAVIILSFGIVYYQKHNPVVIQTADTFNTDSLSTADIVNKLEKSEITEEELIKNIDTKELANQIKIDEKDVNNILDELDETDLTQDM